MTRAVVSAPSKLPRLTIVDLRIAVQPARKKKITRSAKNNWIAACGAEAAISPSIELGVSSRTVRLDTGAVAICDTILSMNFSRLW